MTSPARAASSACPERIHRHGAGTPLTTANHIHHPLSPRHSLLYAIVWMFEYHNMKDAGLRRIERSSQILIPSAFYGSQIPD